MSEHPNAALYAAMSKAFPELDAAVKDRSNPAFKSKYADLGAVIDAIKPALSKHGLFFWQVSHDVDGGACVETIIGHASGGERSLGRVYIPASKKDAHGYGSATTYARRYGLQTAFGIPAEDDDGNAAVKAAPGATQEPTRAPTPMPDDELARLMALAKTADVPTEKLLDNYKVRDLRDLTHDQYKNAITRLTKTAADRAKAATNQDAFGELLNDEIPY